MRPNLLLTGSAGFVGTTIAPLLREAFAHMCVVEVVRQGTPPPGGAAVDLTDREATRALVARVKPSIVVHLAAYSSVALALARPTDVWGDNVIATCWLAEAIAAEAPTAKVFLASSAEVYGMALRDGPANEETAPQPYGPYATSKLASEYAMGTILPATTPLLIARAFNHTGPGQGEAFAIPSFAAQLARIEAGQQDPVLKVGNLSAERDFLDVRDVAAAYVALIGKMDTMAPRTVINLARGQTVSIQSVLSRLIAMARKPVSVTVSPERLRHNEIPIATAQTEKLAAVIPWPPARPLHETLEAVLNDKRQTVDA